MKKAKLTTLLLVCALALTACGSKKDETNDQATATPVPTITESATTTPEPTTEPEVTPDASVDEEFAYPEMDDTIATIHANIVAAYGENYAASMQYDKEYIKNIYGIAPELYDYGIAEGPMMSAHVDTFLAFHATEGNADALEAAINEYRNMLIADTMQYPMNQLKIQASRIYREGDYVFFVMLGFIDETAEYTSDEEIIAAYDFQNSIAINEIIAVLSGSGDSGFMDEFVIPEAGEELTEIRNAVVTAYGDAYGPGMQFDVTHIEMVYGITPDLYSFAVAEGPMMSAHVDTFLAFHATEGNADAIETALNGYRDMLIADTMQYPMNVPKIQGSKVYRNGDYVFFLMLGFIEDESAYETDEQFVEAYSELNNIGIEAIESVLSK